MAESTLKPYNLAEAGVKPAPNKNFIASFHIGMNERSSHVSEAQDHFKKPSEEAYKADKDLKANIRFIKGNHFQFGSDPSEQNANHFVTLNEQIYQSREAEMAKLSKDVQADLRKSHFTVGNVPEPIISTSQKEFTDKSKIAEKATFKSLGLRDTHFALGDGKPDFVSMKMLNYRDPTLV